ncbi:MAG TPA: hypothetical protein VKZ85_16140 [Woeseiaceae bacterium]|nr:hypothetical protein [Woeseiaceae bacterium]
MGTEQFGPYISKRAGADLRDKQYYAVVLDTDGEIQVATSGVGIGILVDNPNEGEYGTIQVAEGAKWVAAGAINPGTYVTSDANGRAIPASAGDERLAFLKEAAVASGHVVSVQIVHAGQANA